jgi:hypothetical protein
MVVENPLGNEKPPFALFAPKRQQQATFGLQ